VSGRREGTPEVEAQLTVPPTAAERLAALEAERDSERKAIQELEADLRKAGGGRPPMDAAERFRRTVALAFGLAAVIVGGIIALLAGLRR
jgi:hypothetical protein